jgi:hypothetical protein
MDSSFFGDILYIIHKFLAHYFQHFQVLILCSFYLKCRAATWL